MKNLIAKFGKLPSYVTIFYILVIIFFTSCKTKQLVSNQSTTTVHDTIRDYRLDIRYNAVHDTLSIENPCDSLGILKDFYSKTTLPQGKVVIRSHKGNIQATIDIDSIAQVYDSKYKSIIRKSAENKETIVRINTIPKWAIWVMAIGAIFTFLYLRNFILKFTT